MRWFCTFILLLLSVNSGVAQRDTRLSDSTSTHDAMNEYFLGFGIGANYASLLGAQNFYFHTSAGDLYFKNLGGGFGPMISISLHSPIGERFGYIAQAELMWMNSSRVESPGTEEYSKKWDFAGGSVLLRAALTDRTYVLGGLGYYTMTFDLFNAKATTSDGYHVDLQKFVSLDYYNPLRLDLKLGGGLILPWKVFDKYFVTPELLANIPISPLYTFLTQQDYAGKNALPPNLYYLSLTLKLQIPLFSDHTAEKPVAMDSFYRPAPRLLRFEAPEVTPHVTLVRPPIVTLEKLRVRGPLVVHFEFDSSRIERLSSNDSDELRLLASDLLSDRSKSVIVEGHADSVGSDAYNMMLSRNRANELRKYLMMLGVRSSQIWAAAYGATKPVGLNTSEEGRAENRRVVLEIKE